MIDEPWRLSDPNPADAEAHPIGQEYTVPLCKTGSGSFMILDLDPDKDCEEEVTNPSSIQFYDFPVDVATDNGNDCPKKIEEAIALKTRARHRADDPDLRRRLRHLGGQRRHLPHHPDGRILRRLHLVLERRRTTRPAS